MIVFLSLCIVVSASIYLGCKVKSQRGSICDMHKWMNREITALRVCVCSTLILLLLLVLSGCSDREADNQPNQQSEEKGNTQYQDRDDPSTSRNEKFHRDLSPEEIREIEEVKEKSKELNQ